MLNVDAKRSGEMGGEYMSDDDTGKSLSNIVEKKLILPNLHQKQQSNPNPMNISVDNIKFEEDGCININNNMKEVKENRFEDISGKNNDPYKPKM